MRRFLHGCQRRRRHTSERAALARHAGFRDIVRVTSLLTQTRKGRGLSLDVVADAVGTDPTNLSRVEKGVQVPKRELARALFMFYNGRVPLGAIYDPQFHADNARA